MTAQESVCSYPADDITALHRITIQVEQKYVRAAMLRQTKSLSSLML